MMAEPINDGVIFKVTPTGKLTVLHNFVGTDGSHPYAGLVQATDGNLYGTTSEGGTSTNCTFGCGTIFKISPGGSGFSVLYNFDNTTGANPQVALVQNTNGVLYGDTESEGSGTAGVFYSLNEGLKPFVSLLPYSGSVGKTIEFLGQGFTGASAVAFNGTAATFKIISDTYLTATVLVNATTGLVTVTTPGGTLTSNKTFRVTPQVTGFNQPAARWAQR